MAIFASKTTKMREISLTKLHFYQQATSAIKEIYFNSFPPEERRSWDSINHLLSQNNSPYNIYIILCDGEVAGFISWWQFLDFCYIEHFAIKQSMREMGIGAKAITQFAETRNSLVVLEVELPNSGEMAQRRIAFYTRNGFTAHPHFEYIQPPYGNGLPSVPLMLMTANTPSHIDLNNISQQLHSVVYGVK